MLHTYAHRWTYSGTPNSATTSMSELSTVAIKDGHRGHLPHHSHQPMNEERADRISRLVGFGEGARTPARQTSVLGSPAAAKATPTPLPAYLREQGQHFSIQSTQSAELQDARMIDGMTYDPDVVDTTSRPPAPSAESGAE